MAQSALTVTTPNPSPPTNLVTTGATPPNPPTYDLTTSGPYYSVSGDMHYPRPELAPFYDDGLVAATPNSLSNAAANGATLNEIAGAAYADTDNITFAAKKAALAVGGTSVDNEALGTETSSTATSATPSAIGQLKMVSCGPVVNTQALRDAGPNASHASTLSGSAVPTLSGVTGVSNVAGPGTTQLTATGTNFNRGSVVNINGVPQVTQFVSATSLTVTNAFKKQTAGAGTIPCTVTSNGITTASVNWTFT